jgi:hypothetical protein
MWTLGVLQASWPSTMTVVTPRVAALEAGHHWRGKLQDKSNECESCRNLFESHVGLPPQPPTLYGRQTDGQIQFVRAEVLTQIGRNVEGKAGLLTGPGMAEGFISFGCRDFSSCVSSGVSCR